MCDQLNGRLKTIAKFGPPADMDTTIRTLIYSSPRMEIDELNYVRRSLERLMGKEYVKKADLDEEAIHKVVSNQVFNDEGDGQYQHQNR
jgi:hypothetical protein